MGLFKKLELWRTRKIIWKWAPLIYYNLFMKDGQNSNTTKLSWVQQIFTSAAPYKTYV